MFLSDADHVLATSMEFDSEEFRKPQPLLVSKKVRQYTSNLYGSTPRVCIAGPSWLLSLEERETQHYTSHLLL